MFGKLMSISDDLMWRYFELLSFRPMDDIAGFRQAAEAGRNPRDFKVMLAQEIVARFHRRRMPSARSKTSTIARRAVCRMTLRR